MSVVQAAHRTASIIAQLGAVPVMWHATAAAAPLGVGRAIYGLAGRCAPSSQDDAVLDMARTAERPPLMQPRRGHMARYRMGEHHRAGLLAASTFGARQRGVGSSRAPRNNLGPNHPYSGEDNAPRGTVGDEAVGA